ncbi:hypothetical protein [Actinomadura formosensis]|uniref:hypothetical protein n=1 Tax=Actinomadura formosensis TaxID=60706 RepID=UPI000A6C5B3F|nr:hypothetical protein [Actinomadura formosensis]
MTTNTADTGDERFTLGLVHEVFALLDQHGYQRGPARAVGECYGLLQQLVTLYEGRDEGEHG